jgi:hypothetical protein
VGHRPLRVSFSNIGAGVLVGALVVARGVRADPSSTPSLRGWELGVRVGVGHPGGAVGSGALATTPQVGDIAEAWVPIGVDAGYRLGPHVYAGAGLEWGPLVGDDSGLCGACAFRYDLQVRGEVRFYLAPRGPIDPWVSLAPGWEVLHLSLGQSTPASAAYQGPFARAEIGIDVQMRRVAVGPYVGAALGGFVTRSLDPATPGVSSSVDVAVHEWFVLGVRGTYGIW